MSSPFGTMDEKKVVLYGESVEKWGEAEVIQWLKSTVGLCTVAENKQLHLKFERFTGSTLLNLRQKVRD